MFRSLALGYTLNSYLTLCTSFFRVGWQICYSQFSQKSTSHSYIQLQRTERLKCQSAFQALKQAIKVYLLGSEQNSPYYIILHKKKITRFSMQCTVFCGEQSIDSSIDSQWLNQATVTASIESTDGCEVADDGT